MSLVKEKKKVVYGSKTPDVETQTVYGHLWTLDKKCNAENGLEDLAEGVENGQLGTWEYVRRAIRQGLGIQCRDRILAENGIIQPKAASKRAIEQAIMAWATVNDTEAWLQVVQRGAVAIDAYYEQAIAEASESAGEPLTPTTVPLVLSSLRS